MARKQLAQEPSGDQLSARMRSFGLGHGGMTAESEPSSKSEPVEEQKESKESEKSPEETDASTTDSTDAEATTTEDEEKEEKPSEKTAKKEEWELKLEAADKARQDAETRERKLQSRLDRQEHLTRQEVTALYNQFSQLKESITQSKGDDGLKPDDLVDAKTVDKKIRDAVARATASTSNVTGPSPEQTRFIQLHPEYEEVIKFGNEKNLMNDPSLLAIPTDAVGLYLAIQNKRLEARLEQVQKDQKAELEKAKAAERKKLDGRGKVPPTGGGGARKGAAATEISEPLTATERMFKTFFDKHAGGSTPIVQVRR